MTVLRAGHARFACEVSDAVGSPAAGTSMPPLSAVGISGLQAGEDVKTGRHIIALLRGHIEGDARRSLYSRI